MHLEHRRVFLLRHGQSTFQVHFESTGIDPGHIDARLSELGHVQVAAVAPAVRALAPDLIVTSPTTRALETVTGVFAGTVLPRTIIDPSVRDRFAGDSCDYGRHPVELAEEFAGFDFSHLAEDWWVPDASRGGATLAEEPRDAFAERVARFGCWLSERPERSILVVGHLGTFRVLTGDVVQNCELREWRPGGTKSAAEQVHGRDGAAGA